MFVYKVMTISQTQTQVSYFAWKIKKFPLFPLLISTHTQSNAHTHYNNIFRQNLCLCLFTHVQQQQIVPHCLSTEDEKPKEYEHIFTNITYFIHQCKQNDCWLSLLLAPCIVIIISIIMIVLYLYYQVE